MNLPAANELYGAAAVADADDDAVAVDVEGRRGEADREGKLPSFVIPYRASSCKGWFNRTLRRRNDEGRGDINADVERRMPLLPSLVGWWFRRALGRCQNGSVSRIRN